MNRKLIALLSKLYGKPWLIRPSVHLALCSAFGPGMEYEQSLIAMSEALNGDLRKRPFEVVGSTAVIPIEGVLWRKWDSVLYSLGITSTDVFERLVRMAAADEAVKAIFLNVDSPGGYSAGIPEAARAVAEANAIKPVMAYADGQMDSAAYWIASQAEAIYATESAEIGSIGVYAAFLDQTRAAEMAGLKVEVFKVGKFKGQGIPGTSLSDAMRDMIQSDVEKIAEQFYAAVRSGRGDVPAEAMEGQAFDVNAAIEMNLIDQVSNAETAMRDTARLIELRAMKG